MATMSNRNNSATNNDRAIIKTASDAVLSKASTASKGYYNDPFLPYFSRDASGLTSSTKNANSATSNVKIHNMMKMSNNGGGMSSNYAIDEGFVTNSKNHYNSSPHTNQQLHSFTAPNTGGAASGPPPYRQQFLSHTTPHQQYRPNYPQSPMSATSQQQPIIRRGTHARVCIIDIAISTFLSLHGHRCSDDNNVQEQNQEGNKEKQDSDNQRHGNDNNSSAGVQIVILGSGRDTTYLRAQCDDVIEDSDGDCLLHHRQNNKNSNHPNVTWYEVDHPSVIQTKFNLLQKCPLIQFQYTTTSSSSTILNDDISYRITPTSISSSSSTTRATTLSNSRASYTRPKTSSIIGSTPETSSTSSNTTPTTTTATTTTGCSTCQSSYSPYHLIGYDLRDSFSNLLTSLCQDHSFDVTKPTLFILECVQMYIPECDSRKLLQSITNSCTKPFLALYDPILLNDAFGKVMENNLTKAGIGKSPTNSTNINTKQDSSSSSSLSLFETRTLQCQITKLTQCGFTFVTGCDMMAAYETIIPLEYRRQANMCEMLDEIEEWMLIMRHYCFIVAAATANTGKELPNESSHTTNDNNRSEKEMIAHLDDCNSVAGMFCSNSDGNPFGFSQRRCLSS